MFWKRKEGCVARTVRSGVPKEPAMRHQTIKHSVLRIVESEKGVRIILGHNIKKLILTLFLALVMSVEAGGDTWFGDVSYAGKAVHRRDTWNAVLNLDQQVVFPTTDRQGDLELTMNFGTPDPSGNIPISIPQSSYEWFSTFVETSLVDFTIDIVATGDATGTLFTSSGGAVDYTRTTSIGGMATPIFSGFGPSGSMIIEQPIGLRIWLGADVRDGEGSILAVAGEPDLSIDFLAVDTTGSGTSAIDPTGCSTCFPDDSSRTVTETGTPFDFDTGAVSLARAVAVLEIPVTFLPPESPFINLQVGAHYSIIPEPATICLLGLGGLLFRRRKVRKF